MTAPLDLPFVTIIMPVRNEADFIARSLGAVLAQDYPHEQLEVFVADGMSGDCTRQIVQQLSVTTDIPVNIIDNAARIVPTGFNAALRQARGTVIVRVDGHCEIAPDYVRRCLDHLAKNEIAGVGGPIKTIGQNRAGKTIAVAMSSGFGVGGTAFRTFNDTAIVADTIAFPAYRREVVDAAGPLDEELIRNQDDEYNYRLRALGYKLLLAPDVKSRYYSRGSIPKLWKQYYQYGLYKVRVMQKHPRQMRPRQFAPPALVAVLLGGVLLSPVHRRLRRLWFAAVGLYGAANLAASIVTARRNGWRHLPLLPVVFATLHMSYGLGFLRGLIKFRNRWSDHA